MSGQGFHWFRKFSLGCLSFLLMFALFCRYFLAEPLIWKETAATPVSAATPVFVLDAGHGGEDCGAIGVNGVYEKDINLKITTYLSAELRLAGYTVVETRTNDALLYDPATVEKGHKKATDLANRLKIANETAGAIVVSIHMNSFPQPSSRGLQVWYSIGASDASRLANGIQARVRDALQNENHRKAKETTGALYLLDHAEHPTVLIECGFLSNPEECARLTDDAYQKELSFVLFCAMMEYINQDV